MENHITDTGGLITDASVILALSFLDKIGAPKLCQVIPLRGKT